MRKLVRVAFTAGASLALSGCILVGAFSGEVKTAEGNVRTLQNLDPGTRVTVPAGASITIIYSPVSPKQCERTYTKDFVVPSSCQKDDDQKKDDQQDQQQDQQQQDQRSQPNQDQASNGGTNTTSGINAPQVTPTPVPRYSSGGGGGISGPQVIATGVPTYTRIMQVVSNPILTNTLAVIGAVSVAKEIRDKTNGNGGDEPISK